MNQPSQTQNGFRTGHGACRAVAMVTLLLLSFLLLFWNKERILGSDFLLWLQRTLLHDVSHHALMFLLPLLLLRLERKSPRLLGLDLPHLAGHLKTGLNLFHLFFLPMVPALWIGMNRWTSALAILAGYALVLPLISRMLERNRFTWHVAVWRVASVTLTMILFARLLHRPWPSPRATASAFVFYFFFVGLGEEFMFRGYIQGRLNDLLGRPYQWRGVSWGLGLPVTAVLFGLFHNLNAGFNPFLHQYTLSIWWSVWTIGAGLLLGIVREKSGSMLPGGVMHGMVFLPQLFFSLG